MNSINILLIITGIISLPIIALSIHNIVTDARQGLHHAYPKYKRECYHEMMLSAYLAQGGHLRLGSLICDLLDKKDYPRIIRTEKELQYFNSNPSFLNEYLVLLTPEEFRALTHNFLNNPNPQ